MTELAVRRLMANYHQFLLAADDGNGPAEVRLPGDDALVTGESGQVSVRTGAYAAPVGVSIEHLETEPGPPGQVWEDVVELSMRCGERITVSELFEGPKATVTSQTGWYRIRVSARGRDSGEQRGEVGARAVVVEHYLIQFWSAPASDGVTIRATSLQPVDHTAGRVHLAPARAAAARINADLDEAPGHRALSGAVGAATAQWIYPASQRKLFRYMAMLNLWTSATASSITKAEVGARYWMSHNDYREIWDGIPTSSRGQLQVTLVEVSAPRLVVSRWVWLDSPFDGEGQSLLAHPTTVMIRLDTTVGVNDQPTTTVQVRHDDLPVEWLHDMTAVWLCKLEAGRDVYPIHR